MKNQSFWAICALLLALTIPALSWVSVKKSQLQRFDAPNEATSIKLIAINSTYSNSELLEQYVSSVYEQAELEATGLNPEVFKKALIGYYNFKKTQLVSTEKPVLTIIDFSRKSSEKRLWIVDLANNRLLFNTLVAHGQGSGGDLATNFSNLENSHQSSLGFYITSDTYFGKHGLSMKLEGMDKGFNTNARDRAVVIHGAEYVSQSFINQHGRLGRSHGCPALPLELTKTIIDAIKGQTCLFINGPAKDYNSNYLDPELAVANFASSSNTVQASI